MRLYCYLFHRSRRTVIVATPLPWPIELADPGFHAWCPTCSYRGGGTQQRTRQMTALPVPA